MTAGYINFCNNFVILGQFRGNYILNIYIRDRYVISRSKNMGAEDSMKVTPVGIGESTDYSSHSYKGSSPKKAYNPLNNPNGFKSLIKQLNGIDPATNQAGTFKA